jgi:SAM-dependent methyltransferase
MYVAVLSIPQRAAATVRRVGGRFRPSPPLRLSGEYVELLRCPECSGRLSVGRTAVACRSGHRFPVVDGVPVFTAAGTDVERRPLDHVSHQAPPELIELFSRQSPWLHLGAGATAVPLPGSLELETAIFRHTHVVGDVHHLPFADSSLGGVLALNVFEHLEDPPRAAQELHRVLRPGAVVVIQTAFLQPLHADPFHFYNATEEGVRRWFREFEIHEVRVPDNFNPAYAFSWMASDLLYRAPPEVQHVLGRATLEELAEHWRDPARRSGPTWDAFYRLGEEARRGLAAGFEVRARRR